MAYEKYIKKNGKIYGPYVYQSKRVNGKVVSEYQGSQKKKKKLEKKNFIAIFALISIFFLVLAYNLFLSPNLTGHSIIEIEENIRGDIISGELILSLKEGKLFQKNK